MSSSVVLRQFPGDTQLVNLVLKGRPATFRRKQIIFSQGDRGHAVFYIDNGGVKLSVTSQQGKERILDVVQEGSFFGEDSLLSSQTARSYSAVALTDARTVAIDSGELLGVCSTQANTSLAFIRYLLQRNAHIQERVRDLLLNSTAGRLVHALLSLQDNSQGGVSRLSQQTLAEMIGSTRQRVNVVAKRLREMGIIEYMGGWRVYRFDNRVLFVDDDPGIRTTLPAILEQHGFNIRVAANVSEALAEIRTGQFDVLLSDLDLGRGGDGFTVAQAMRNANRNCVNIILTGTPLLKNHAPDEELDAYVIKPAETAFLIAIIEQNLLHKRHQFERSIAFIDQCA